MIDPLHFLNEEHYGIYNRPFAIAYGLKVSVLLGELVQRRSYLLKTKQISPDAEGNVWFYFTIEDVQGRTGLSKHEQETALKFLEEKEFIFREVKGLPAKRFFRLNNEKIAKSYEELLGNKFAENQQTSLPETGNQACRKPETTSEDFGKPCSKNPENSSYIEKNQKKNQNLKRGIAREQLPSLLDFGKFVKLTNEDYQALATIHGNEKLDSMIEKLNDYCASTGKSYKDHAATLRNWFRREQQSAQKPSSTSVDRRTKNKDGSPIEAPYDNLF